MRPFPDDGAKRQMSVNGGSQPVWRSDRTELSYLGGAPAASIALARASLVKTTGFQQPPMTLAGSHRIPAVVR